MDAPPTSMSPRAFDPIRILRGIWREREVIGQLTRKEVFSTYRESFMGTLWLLVQPLLSLAVYAFVFIQIFTQRGGAAVSPVDFVLGMFAGMIVFWCFSEVVSRSPSLILRKRSYVKNVVFPLEVLPITVLGSSLVGLGAGIVILLIAVGVVHQTVSSTIYLFPLVLLPLVLLTLGLSWLLSSLGVFVRDLQPGIRAVLQLLFFATPIVWRVDILPADIQPWILLNPLAWIVEGARGTLVEGRVPSWGGLGVTTLFSLLVFLGGFTWFERTRKGFADVV